MDSIMSVEKKIDLLAKELEILKQKYMGLNIKYMLSRSRELMYQQMISNYIVENYYRQPTNDFDIGEVMQSAHTVMANKDFKHLSDDKSMLGEFLKRCFDTKTVQFKHKTWSLDFDIALIFGIKETYENSRLILSAMTNDKKVIFGEAGFLCSVAPFIRSDLPFKYRQMHALVLDKSCMYIDGRHTSDLERLLNSNLELSEAQICRAKSLIKMIVQNKISKYNHQPIRDVLIGKRKRKILVVDQVYGDASISLGMATEDTFFVMLKAAVEENPDADIIIKTHPDTNNTLKQRHFKDCDMRDLHIVDYDLNPYSLLEVVDKVYVVSSQMGFEALMAGKEVHTFGMPFYAGWGATIDQMQCDRRIKKRSVEEIFYIFYVMYTRYVSYKTNGPCEIEQVIQELIDMREDYWHEFITDT